MKWLYVINIIHQVSLEYATKSLKIPKDWVIRSRKSKDRQHNDQKKKDKRIKNDLQNITQKTNDWATRIPLKTGGELRYSGCKQFLLHMWLRACYSCYKAADKSWMRKGRIVITTNGKYPWSFVTQILRNG